MKDQMPIQSPSRLFSKAKPFLAVIFLQLGLAGMAIIAKLALDEGLNHYTFVVYRNFIATCVISPFAITLERKVRPKMTFTIFAKIALLGLLEPVIDQNLYYSGMRITSATFTTAMCNILPALTFLMAFICRLEKVKIKKVRSQAKVVGTLVTVGGAMLMTLIKGPVINLPWTKGRVNNHGNQTTPIHQDPIKGSLMIAAGCFCWSCFIILQAITLREYPAELTLTALICLMGAAEGAVVALALQWGKSSIWSIHWDAKFLAALYGGIVCSGVSYYIQAVIIKKRGPVFVTAFSPLCMIIVAILGSFILAEQMFVGSVIGAIVIVVGLYLVVWGKIKDHVPSSPADNELIPVTPVDDKIQMKTGSISDGVDRKENEKPDHHEFVAIGVAAA
ncbi:PREDICTED: WAT1-related protein At2g39510-like [Nelumbo nucifera]|uniref:WAT1-related protein n=1 Tax=Nelumbo nucifera TaxID=4432 RepID=A0A1U7ZZZ2_NELNU|nr:PREDICTED: WAT1-related protein At2g39510-like [Nelumbo nucifera]